LRHPVYGKIFYKFETSINFMFSLMQQIGYELDNWGLIPGRGREGTSFSLPAHVEWLKPIQPPIRGSFLGGKVAGA
jgi:hypothetical protein